MSAIIFLILASLFVAIGFLIAFLWAVKSGQFEDKHTPAIRMLFDENSRTGGETNKQQNADG